MHFAGPAAGRMWFFICKFAGAVSAKRIHALQRRFEQGLLHRKVHEGQMRYLLLGAETNWTASHATSLRFFRRRASTASPRARILLMPSRWRTCTTVST